MKNGLKPGPDHIKKLINVPFHKMPALWQLIGQDKNDLYSLAEMKARKHFSKLKCPPGLSPSKYAEKHLKKHYSESEVKKAINELNTFVGKYLQDFVEGLANNWYLNNEIDSPAKQKKKIRKTFIRMRELQLAGGVPMKRIYSSFLEILKQERREGEHNIKVNRSTLRTWNHRQPSQFQFQ